MLRSCDTDDKSYFEDEPEPPKKSQIQKSREQRSSRGRKISTEISDKKTKKATSTVDRRQHLTTLDSLRYPKEYKATPRRVKYQAEREQFLSKEFKTESCLPKAEISVHNPPQERGRGSKKQGETIFKRIARSMSPISGRLKNREPRRRFSKSPGRAERPKTDRRRGGRRNPERDSKDMDLSEAMDELGF
jgi:hypothetical protein